MKNTIWCHKALILLCFYYMAGCREKNENLTIPDSFLPVSNIMKPVYNPDEKILPPDEDVFICKSTAAKRYHLNQSCRGLKRCKREIVELNLINAENRGLTLCGYEK